MHGLSGAPGSTMGGPHAGVIGKVAAFYERHPYPPPKDDLENYRGRWNDARRRADSHLFWPHEPYRDDRTILVAGCGVSQAARYAMRWPRAQVVGIDVSATSLEFSDGLKRKYRLTNLELHRLPVERAAHLARTFDHVVCTGVLHHLGDPDAGLAALRETMEPGGVLHLMVYAPYGRAGVYLLQDYCRRLGIGVTRPEIADLLASLKALSPDHPLVPLLRNSPDFGAEAGIADALLNPQDRPYDVPQLFELLRRGGLQFHRWIRQAPYLPSCGAIATSPHAPRLAQLARADQYAAIELFRGTMVRHSLAACRDANGAGQAISFEGDAWPGYVPIRLPETITVRERLPPGAAAVLINQGHTYTDLYLPISGAEARLLEAIDGTRTIAQIAGPDGLTTARSLFRRLWDYDQVVFDASGAA
jgi:SAM-dependent methyltransferase